MGGSSTADLIGAVVNAAKTTWDIVKDGKPQAGASSSFCQAVPDKLKFTELSGWKSKSGTWRYVIENGYGMKVINFELVWSFDYGGKAASAPGALFVNNFTVYAKSASALWGYSGNVNATVKGNPTNVGSGGKIIGAVPLMVSASYSQPFKADGTTWLLKARGDGGLDVS